MTYYGYPAKLRAEGRLACMDAPKADRPLRKADATLCIPPKPEVLLVVGPCGTLEVYTSRHMRIHIAKKLKGLPKTIKSELLADEYMELRLPQWARELYAPENLQRTETIRLLSPSQEVERRLRTALVKECRTILEEKRNDGTATRTV